MGPTKFPLRSWRGCRCPSQPDSQTLRVHPMSKVGELRTWEKPWAAAACERLRPFFSCISLISPCMRVPEFGERTRNTESIPSSFETNSSHRLETGQAQGHQRLSGPPTKAARSSALSSSRDQTHRTTSISYCTSSTETLNRSIAYSFFFSHLTSTERTAGCFFGLRSSPLGFSPWTLG